MNQYAKSAIYIHDYCCVTLNSALKISNTLFCLENVLFLEINLLAVVLMRFRLFADTKNEFIKSHYKLKS